jgi:hypothetical protein
MSEIINLSHWVLDIFKLFLNVLFIIFVIGSHYVPQAGLELLDSSNPLASTSQVVLDIFVFS